MCGSGGGDPSLCFPCSVVEEDVILLFLLLPQECADDLGLLSLSPPPP